MKETIELPVSELSFLKKVHLNMDLNGNHFSQLALFDGKSPDQLALSILKDLVEEDADLLTEPEVTYLFHLVKVHSLREEIEARYNCPYCKTENHYIIDLSDGKLNRPSSDYKAPTLNWVPYPGREPLLCKVMPLPMSKTIALQNYFLEVLDINLTTTEDKKAKYDYGMLQAIMALVGENNSPIYNSSCYDQLDEILKANTYHSVMELLEAEKSVNSYGPRLNYITQKCKECGKDATFHATLFLGLTH